MAITFGLVVSAWSNNWY